MDDDAQGGVGLFEQRDHDSREWRRAAGADGRRLSASEAEERSEAQHEGGAKNKKRASSAALAEGVGEGTERTAAPAL